MYSIIVPTIKDDTLRDIFSKSLGFHSGSLYKSPLLLTYILGESNSSCNVKYLLLESKTGLQLTHEYSILEEEQFLEYLSILELFNTPLLAFVHNLVLEGSLIKHSNCTNLSNLYHKYTRGF